MEGKKLLSIEQVIDLLDDFDGYGITCIDPDAILQRAKDLDFKHETTVYPESFERRLEIEQ